MSDHDYNTKYTIELDGYQVANLRALLKAAITFNGFNTGDWIGEIPHKLPDVKWNPNQTAESMVAQVKADICREALLRSLPNYKIDYSDPKNSATAPGLPLNTQTIKGVFFPQRWEK